MSVNRGAAMFVVRAVLSTPDPAEFITASLDELTVDLGGIPGERHYGMTMKSDVRYPMYPRGTEIKNRRQLTAVSVEELEAIALRLGLPEIKPEWLGANLLLEGLPDLTLLPPGNRLIFPSGCGLVCEGENDPCRGPGKVIQAANQGPASMASAFVKAAWHKRGVVLSVERPGVIRPGDEIAIDNRR